MKKAIAKMAGLAGLTLALIVASGPGAQADLITLSDYNSTATIDHDSDSGMNSWVVDGVNHLYQQWFWYRVGSNSPEASIDTLTLSSESTYNGTRGATLIYTDTDFEIQVDYSLLGGTAGSGWSDIAETIAIRNLSDSSLEFTFFQYSDFDLNGTISNDTGYLANPNLMAQYDAITGFSETTAVPAADLYQVDFYSNILTALNDGVATNLSNAGGPITGDVTWAWQWDITIPVGGVYIISKDKNLHPIPEPATVLLLGAGLAGLVFWGRRKRGRS